MENIVITPFQEFFNLEINIFHKFGIYVSGKSVLNHIGQPD